MTRPKNLITEDGLRICMPPKYKDLPIHIFDTLDSTNARAKELASDGASHGSVVLAHQQTSGRGRLGRSFFSPREGIYLTIILRLGPSDCSVQENRRHTASTNHLASCAGFPGGYCFPPTLVTAAAAVAVAESIEEVCGKSAGIKWVNDIYVDGKKVCGILTEGVTDYKSGNIESLVVGIGINTTLTGFPPELMEIAGALEGDYSKAALAASIISKLLDFTEELAGQGATQEVPAGSSNAASTSPVPRFIKTYREKSLVMGKTITVYKGAYRSDPQEELPGRSARVLDINDTGGLCVIYTDGTRETLTSGEISIRL